MTVTDLPDPDGVSVAVTGTGTEKVTITLTNPVTGAPCGTVRLLPGSEVDLTCGSITVNVVAGSAEIVLSDDTSLFVDAGEEATISISTNGTFVVTAAPGGGVSRKVTLRSDGVSMQVSPSTAAINLWDFVGYSHPVDNGGVFNIVKPGATGPLKLAAAERGGRFDRESRLSHRFGRPDQLRRRRSQRPDRASGTLAERPSEPRRRLLPAELEDRQEVDRLP